MDTKTLGEFIEGELDRRKMTAREFARFVDVPNSLINRYRFHGVADTYAGKPVGNPSIEFIHKLAKATHVDLCSLIALVIPDAGVRDPEARILADFIIGLPPGERREAEVFVKGLVSEMRKKQK